MAAVACVGVCARVKKMSANRVKWVKKPKKFSASGGGLRRRLRRAASPKVSLQNDWMPTTGARATCVMLCCIAVIQPVNLNVA